MNEYVIIYDDGQSLKYVADDFADLFDSYTIDERHVISIVRIDTDD